MPRYRATFSGSPGLNQPSLWMHALLQSLQEQSSFSFIIIIFLQSGSQIHQLFESHRL
jgi:hypothetical protein